MNADRSHPREEIQDLLDGRLDPARNAEVEAHLARCESCRKEAEALDAVRAALRTRLPETPIAEIDLNVLLGRPEAIPVADARPKRRWFLAAAAVFVAALALWATRGLFAPSPDLVSRVVADLRDVSSGNLSLTLATSDPAELERRFAHAGIEFPTHVYDLAMMEVELAGGRVHDVDGRESALFAYRSATGGWIVCQMYRGDEEELPAAAEIREERGFHFHVYRRGGTTVVFWEEGAIVCALASNLPASDVVGLAAAKAMRL